MRKTVVTIVGRALDAATEARAAQIVRELGVENLRSVPLHPDRALDLLIDASAPALTLRLREKLAGLGSFDIFVQPDDETRKKKLLVADMDATMIEQETLDELAAHFNLKDKIAPITEKAMRGEIDFQEALRLRVGMLRGLPVAALTETLKAVRPSAGAAALVKTMRRFGAQCVLVSGGFDIFTGHVAALLGFHRDFSNRLGMAEGRLTGEVVPPIIDKHAKQRVVEEQARAAGCTLRQVVAIGDGANDIPMLQTAGTGIGYFGKPAVVATTPHQIRHTDLTAVLYMQGYRQEEISS